MPRDGIQTWLVPRKRTGAAGWLVAWLVARPLAVGRWIEAFASRPAGGAPRADARSAAARAADAADGENADSVAPAAAPRGWRTGAAAAGAAGTERSTAGRGGGVGA